MFSIYALELVAAAPVHEDKLFADEARVRLSVGPRPPQDFREIISLLVMLMPVTAKKYQHSGLKLSEYIFMLSSL